MCVRVCVCVCACVFVVVVACVCVCVCVCSVCGVRALTRAQVRAVCAGGCVWMCDVETMCQ